jgi:hypothetical protein
LEQGIRISQLALTSEGNVFISACQRRALPGKLASAISNITISKR